MSQSVNALLAARRRFSVSFMVGLAFCLKAVVFIKRITAPRVIKRRQKKKPRRKSPQRKICPRGLAREIVPPVAGPQKSDSPRVRNALLRHSTPVASIPKICVTYYKE